MTKKQHLINLNNEFDSNLLIKDIKKYNDVLILNQIYNLFVKIQLNYIEKLIT